MLVQAIYGLLSICTIGEGACSSTGLPVVSTSPRSSASSSVTFSGVGRRVASAMGTRTNSACDVQRRVSNTISHA